MRKKSLVKRQGNTGGEQTQRELHGIDSARSQHNEASISCTEGRAGCSGEQICC